MKQRSPITFRSDEQRKAVFASLMRSRGYQKQRKRELVGAGVAGGAAALLLPLAYRFAAISMISRAGRRFSLFADRKITARAVRRGFKRGSRILRRKSTTPAGMLYVSKRGKAIAPTLRKGKFGGEVIG